MVLNTVETLGRRVREIDRDLRRQLQGLNAAVADAPHAQGHPTAAQQKIGGVEVGAVELLALPATDGEGAQQRQAAQLVELGGGQQQLEFDFLAHPFPEDAIRNRWALTSPIAQACFTKL